MKALNSIFEEINEKQSLELERQMVTAKNELKKLQRNILGLNLNNFAMNKTFTGADDFNEQLGVSGYLYLHQEVLRKREWNKEAIDDRERRLLKWARSMWC